MKNREIKLLKEDKDLISYVEKGEFPEWFVKVFGFFILIVGIVLILSLFI